MTWFTFSLLSITALATAELLQQKLLNGVNNFDEKTSSFLTFLFQAILILPIIFFTRDFNNFFDIFTSATAPYFLVTSILGTLASFLYLKSFKVKNISISTIFVALSAVVSTTLGIVFLGESVYFAKLLGILLVLTAIIILNKTNLKIEKNNYYGLGAGLLFGTAYTIDKMIVTSIDYMVYVFWATLFVAVFGFIFASKQIIKTINTKNLTDYKPILFSTFSYLLFNLCTFKAYSLHGEVGRVDAINNSQIFLLILAEYFILKQKDNAVKKLLTAGIAFTGVFILGIF